MHRTALISARQVSLSRLLGFGIATCRRHWDNMGKSRWKLSQAIDR
jgi:hypothetical protein